MRSFALLVKPAGGKHDRAAADFRKLVLNLVVFDALAFREDLFQQRFQRGNVPLAVAQFKNGFAGGLAAGGRTKSTQPACSALPGIP